MSKGGWILIIVLLVLLVGTGAVAYMGWTLSDVDVPLSAYFAMGLGIVFSLAVGCGLMALIFYSNRKGYDEPARLIRPEEDETGSEDSK